MTIICVKNYNESKSNLLLWYHFLFLIKRLCCVFKVPYKLSTRNRFLWKVKHSCLLWINQAGNVKQLSHFAYIYLPFFFFLWMWCPNNIHTPYHWTWPSYSKMSCCPSKAHCSRACPSQLSSCLLCQLFNNIASNIRWMWTPLFLLLLKIYKHNWNSYWFWSPNF